MLTFFLELIMLKSLKNIFFLRCDMSTRSRLFVKIAAFLNKLFISFFRQPEGARETESVDDGARLRREDALAGQDSNGRRFSLFARLLERPENAY